MRTIFPKVNIYAALLMGIFLVGFSAVFFNTYAQSNSWDVKGWIWNDSYGWASVSCLNAKDGVICGNDGELSGVEGVEYGVSLKLDDLTLTGYAWSTGVGWISFNSEDVTNSAGECPHSNPVPRLVYTNIDDIHLEGCAVVVLGNEVISLGKSPSSSVEYGIKVKLVVPNSSLGDAYALTLYGCAWSDRSGWWSFGDKNGTAKCFSNSNITKHATKTDINIIVSRLSVSKEIALFGEPIEVGWNCGAPRRLTSNEGLKSSDNGKIFGGYRYIVSAAEKMFRVSCSDVVFGSAELQKVVKANTSRVSLSVDPEFVDPVQGTDVSISWSFEVFERGVTFSDKPCLLNGHPVAKNGNLNEDIEGSISLERVKSEINYSLVCSYTKNGETKIVESSTAVRALPDPEQVRERN